MTKGFTSRSAKQRLVVKGFKTSQDMHNFLNKGDNALTWSEYKVNPISRDNLAPGTYAYVGQKWVNVKKLDIYTLAHV